MRAVLSGIWKCISKDAAEKAKIELSSTTKTNINLPFITADATGPKHLDVDLTRAKFDALTESLVKKTLKPMEQAMKDAQVSSSDINRVILVGGSTRIPAVVEAVKKYTGKEPYKGINRKNLLENLTEPVITYASINLVFAMATVFGQLLTIEQIPQIITQVITSLTENKWVVLLLLNLLLLVVGTFMEPLSAIIILTPILLPIAQAFGIDLVHFGVLITVNLAIGFLTPPIGMNLFVGSQIGDVSMESLVKGVLPFLAALLVVLFIVNVIPQLTLFLPELMSR